MKVYGWDDTGVQRGELLAAIVDAAQLYYGVDILAGELGWERAFTSFAEARKQLVNAMSAEGVDQEIIDLVRSLKAAYVPLTGGDA
jgi:hypothetical protein